MNKIIRTDATHPDFIELVRRLDAELAERDGAEHSLYAQYNKIGGIKYAVIAYGPLFFRTRFWYFSA